MFVTFLVFHDFVVICRIFFKINFFKKFFKEHYQSFKCSVGPYLGPNCLQKLSVDDKSYHQQGKS